MFELKARFTNAIHKNRLGTALLFLGENEDLKEQTALQLGAGLLCENKAIPYGCGECTSCKHVLEKRSPRLRFLEPENEQKSEIKVDQIRDLISASGNPSWIIPKAHLLNKQASNALLKTLEEPRSGQFFILLAPDTRSLLPTLVSRCQRIFFGGSPANKLEAPEIPTSLFGRIELIDRLIKDKADLNSLFTAWSQDASAEFKEALFKAQENLKRHANAQLTLEALLLSKNP
ncbi:MAG: hypothetical protein V4534_00465 [Myxococcota bacterium]